MMACRRQEWLNKAISHARDPSAFGWFEHSQRVSYVEAPISRVPVLGSVIMP